MYWPRASESSRLHIKKAELRTTKLDALGEAQEPAFQKKKKNIQSLETTAGGRTADLSLSSLFLSEFPTFSYREHVLLL